MQISEAFIHLFWQNSGKLFKRLKLSVVTLEITKHCPVTLDIFKLGKIKLSVVSVDIIKLSAVTLGITKLVIFKPCTVTLGIMTLGIMTHSKT
jgi:hypothetical protein